jgi:TrmH family RNA methyltransferase
LAATGPVDSTPLLSHISVVLVRPRQPENVGYVARAVANHGLGPLILVNPKIFDPERARWSAPGARDRIDEARIVGSIQEAVADFDQVFATTARERRIEQTSWSPQELCDDLLERPRTTAILFGPEDSGLRNDEIANCRALLRIPTGTASSLNLAQAVTALCSILRHEIQPPTPLKLTPSPATNMALQELFIDEAMELLEHSGYLVGRNSNRVQTTLFQLLTRVQVDGSELGLLRGMLKAARHKAGIVTPRD